MATVVKDLQSAASPSAIHGQQLIPQVSHALESSSDSDAAADVYDFQTWQYDFDDEEPVVTVDDLIQQLASADDASALMDCLKQLTRTNYSIAGCDQWHSLLQLLPKLLRADVTSTYLSNQNHGTCSDISAAGPTAHISNSSTVATAAQQLLLDKLAPEVLDCSPEPLAQLLTAFLSTNRHNIPLQETGDPLYPLSSHGTKAEQHCHSNVPDGVIQLLVVGLHKIARQWHFLDQGTSTQLCYAIADALATPLQLLLESELCYLHAEVNLQQQQQQAESTLRNQLEQRLQQQEQQQVLNQPISVTSIFNEVAPDQPTCCCIAEQLLLHDPPMGWLHRLNACSSSGRPFRQSMQESCLIQQLLRCVAKLCASGWLLNQDHEAAQQACKSSQPLQVHEQSSSDAVQHITGHTQQYNKQQLRRCSIIAAHLLTTLLETRAGRLSIRTVQQNNDAHHDCILDSLRSTGRQSTASDTAPMPDIVSKLVDAIKQLEKLYSSLESSAAAVGDATLGRSVVTAARMAIAARAEQCAEHQDIVSPM